jgi:polyisoprenoid-binding protein YceI
MLPENFKRTSLVTAIVIVIILIAALLITPRMEEEEVAQSEVTTETTTTTMTTADTATAAAVNNERAIDPDAAQAWAIIPAESRLGFEGSYSSSGFSGRFQQFSAMLHFDPEDLEHSLFDVTIDVTTVTTFNADWDAVLGEKDWFNINKYPKAKYIARSFRQIEGNNFAADGTLDLKGHEREVILQFTWNEGPDGSNRLQGQAQLLGQTEVDRRNFRIGDGDWSEDDTVAFQVLVKVDLLLEAAAP